MNTPSIRSRTASAGPDVRAGDPGREAGFTLIELLVVVIIIGILAAIANPVYLGVQNNAKDSAVKSDLSHAKTALIGWSSANGGDLPAQSGFDPSATGLNLVKYGWVQSANTTSLVYTASGSGAATLWCVLGTGATGKKWAISTNTAVTGGTSASTCPASL